MPNVLYVAGEKFNVLERSSLVVFIVGDQVALFPLSNAYAGRPSRPAQFEPHESGVFRFRADTNQLANDDFETWPLTTWTVDELGGTGTVEQTMVGAEVHAGTSAAKLTGGDNGVRVYQDITARSGEKRRIDAWLVGDGTANGVGIRIQNLRTGRYLTSAGAWQTTATNCLSRTTATYGQVNLSYTVESFTRCHSDLVTLRVEVIALATVEVFADDVRDWPAVDMLSLHGVNLEDCTTIAWSTSDDGSTFGDTVTLGDAAAGFSADQRPTMYYKRASTVQDKPWHDLHFVGSTALAFTPEIGQIILAQVATAARNYDWRSELQLRHERITNETGAGDRHVYRRTRWPSRVFGANWQFTTDAEMRESRDDLFSRAGGDALNVLLVPDDSQNVVLLGRIDHTWSVQRAFTSHYTEHQMSLAELPFAPVAL